MVSPRSRFGARVFLICTLSIAPGLAIFPTMASAQPEALSSHAHHSRRFVEVGVPSTGLNRNLGQPIWRYPALEPFIPLFGEEVALLGFRTVGAFDPLLGPGNGNSPALSPVTPGDTLVASHLDDIGLTFAGLDPSTVPFSVLNIPLDDTEVLVDEAGLVHQAVPCASDTASPTTITRAAPCHEPITLDTWRRARGLAVFDCRPSGTTRARLLLRHLLPNRMYSIWLAVENFEAGPQFLIRPIPFGGVPNIVTTDRFGRANLDRTLSFCPHDQPQALGIAVVMRSNGQNYGGVPVPFLNQQDPAAFDGFAGLIPGSVAVVQLSFNIGGIALDPETLGALEDGLTDDELSVATRREQP